jgi:hypothetical protein
LRRNHEYVDLQPRSCYPTGMHQTPPDDDMEIEQTGVDVFNGIVTGDIAATLTANSGVANAAGPKVMVTYRRKPPAATPATTTATASVIRTKSRAEDAPQGELPLD